MICFRLKTNGVSGSGQSTVHGTSVTLAQRSLKTEQCKVMHHKSQMCDCMSLATYKTKKQFLTMIYRANKWLQ